MYIDLFESTINNAKRLSREFKNLSESEALMIVCKIKANEIALTHANNFEKGNTSLRHISMK